MFELRNFIYNSLRILFYVLGVQVYWHWYFVINQNSHFIRMILWMKRSKYVHRSQMKMDPWNPQPNCIQDLTRNLIQIKSILRFWTRNILGAHPICWLHFVEMWCTVTQAKKYIFFSMKVNTKNRVYMHGPAITRTFWMKYKILNDLLSKSRN